MDLDGISLSEINKTEKDKYCIISCISRKIKQTSKYNEEEKTHRYREQTSDYQWGERRGEGSQ